MSASHEQPGLSPRVNDLVTSLAAGHAAFRLVPERDAARIYQPWNNLVAEVRPGDTPEDWCTSIWLVRPDRRDRTIRWFDDAADPEFALAAEVLLSGDPEPDWEGTFTVPGPLDAGRTLESCATSAIAEGLLLMRTTDLRAAVPGLVVRYAEGVVPFQAEGTWNGHEFYFRYRHGSASLSVGGDDPVAGPWLTAYMDYGDRMGGSLVMAEFTHLFCSLGRRLAPAPFRYEFASDVSSRRVSTAGLDSEEQTRLAALLREPLAAAGFSEAEARARLAGWVDQVRQRHPDADVWFDVDRMRLVRDGSREIPDNWTEIFRVLSIPPLPEGLPVEHVQ